MNVPEIYMFESANFKVSSSPLLNCSQLVHVQETYLR